ncbi:MAG: SLC13 family permease [Gemmatimonadaceae bacterium]
MTGASPYPGQVRMLLLAGGPILHVAIVALAPAEVSRAAAHVLGAAAWMALWWLTEVVPLAATSLLPIALFPILGVTSTAGAAAPYANQLVFLFLAGFLLAAAMERWSAHVRIAYGLVLAIGLDGRRIVLGMMIATAFISMWISNTATAAMMYPIALAVGALFGEDHGARNMRTALMLGIAYAASIGGLATLIGTPPNLVFAGAAAELAGREVGFVDFMLVGLPIAAILLPATWVLLVFVVFPGTVALGTEAKDLIRGRRDALGSLRGGEALTLMVFAMTAAAWLFREPKVFGTITVPGLTTLVPQLSDAAIGMAGAILLFVLRARSDTERRRPLLIWDEARRIPWEVLLLFGGGLSLASAMEGTGVARWLGGLMSGLALYPTVLIYAGLAAIVLCLSELASNTAVAAMTMPIAASLAHSVNEPPLALMLVAALAASIGFALPVATPPNTIVFGSGQVTVRQMARAGLLLDVVALAIVVAAVALLYPIVFG